MRIPKLRYRFAAGPFAALVGAVLIAGAGETPAATGSPPERLPAGPVNPANGTLLARERGRAPPSPACPGGDSHTSRNTAS